MELERSKKTPSHRGPSHPAPLSEKTIKFLMTMMKEANIPVRCQQELLKAANEGKKLPFPARTAPAVEKPEPRHVKKLEFPQKYGLRQKHTIVQSGAYQREQFRPCPSKIRPPKEKERLQNLMAYGKERILDLGNPVKHVEEEEVDTDVILKDRFEEILIEIEERQRFLQEMSDLGLHKVYASQIESEISQRVHELDELRKEKDIDWPRP